MSLSENRTMYSRYCPLCDSNRDDDGICGCTKLLTESKGYDNTFKKGIEAIDSVGKQALIAQDAANRSVYEREIWNKAIEAAASECDMLNDWLSHKIRRLKK